MMETESKKLQQALVIVLNKSSDKAPEDRAQKMAERKETKSDVDENEQE